MVLTNNHNLPDPIFRAIKNKGRPDLPEADIWATRLIDSPQVRILTKKYRDQIEEDAIDKVWSLLGDSVHIILEKANLNGLVEIPLTAHYPPYYVGAIVDHYEDGIHTDYKLTSAWSLLFDKGEWEMQLNIGTDILEENGHFVSKHQNVIFLRDWNKNEAARNPDYPQQQVVVKEQLLWPEDVRKKYINTRLERHFGELKQYECTDKDRWYTGTKYAVKHKDLKRAKSVHDTKEEAEAWIGDYIKDDVKKLYIEERKGEHKRCERYCGVAPFCPQWRKINEELSSNS